MCKEGVHHALHMHSNHWAAHTLHFLLMHLRAHLTNMWLKALLDTPTHAEVLCFGLMVLSTNVIYGPWRA